VNPVIAVRVSDAAVQRICRQHKNEVGRLSDAYQKILVEPADPKALYVDVNAEAVQSEVDFQQTSTYNNSRNITSGQSNMAKAASNPSEKSGLPSNTVLTGFWVLNSKQDLNRLNCVCLVTARQTDRHPGHQSQ